MDDCPGSSPVMTRASAWLVDQLATLLGSDERDAVQGDMAELQLTVGRALRDVLGLIVRRQAGWWRCWQPWVALLALTIPLGPLFGVVSRQLAVSTAIYTWLYGDWWSWAFLTNAAARLDLTRTVGTFALAYIALTSWAWACGFALGSLSRRTVGVHATVFGVMFVGGAFAMSPAGRVNPANAAVFALPVFRVVLPTLLPALLVGIPLLRGMSKGMQPVAVPALRTIIFAVAISVLTIREAVTLEGGTHVLRTSWTRALVPWVAAWPGAYLAAVLALRRKYAGNRMTGRDF